MSDTIIHPTAVIGPNVVIGHRVYIGPLCIVGYPAEHIRYWPAMGRVIIEDGAILTGLVTVDAATCDDTPTTIGSGAMLLKHSHVGHDAQIGKNAIISCGAKIGGHARIGQCSNIGLNAAIHQWVVVPDGCMVGMGAVVTKRLAMEANMKYAGVPARCLGPNNTQR